MFNKLLLGVAALSILAGAAYAENSATTASTAQVADNSAANPPPPVAGDEGQGWWGRWRGHHGHHGQMGGPDGGPDGGMGGRGGPGMMMDHQGFRLHMGNGIEVGVMCGKDALKDCIAEAQPLIDAAKAAAAAQPQAKAQ